MFNLPAVVLALCVVLAAIHLIRMQVLSEAQDFALLLRGAVIPAIYTGQFGFDLWSFTAPVTYTLLHGDVLHLAVNLVWLAAFGSPLANRLGARRFLFFWVFCGVAAAALHCALHMSDQAPLIGASGAVAGMMGAAARFGFVPQRSQRGSVFGGPPLSFAAVMRSRPVLVFLAAWMAVNAFTGLVGGMPGVAGKIAWKAHVGGFLAGFLGLELFLPQRHRDA